VLVLPDGAGSSSEARRCSESEPVVDARNSEAVLKPGGYGTVCSARVLAGCRGLTPKPFSSGGGEATLNACGVGVAMLPGYS
jgi:hypothetical protein